MRDEFAKIDWLKSRFELDGESEGLVIGIGDDAAVFDFGTRPTVVTVDTQVEDVHFRRDLISSRDIGRRAVIAAASDVWAMGAMPNACVIALTLSPESSDQDFKELVEGMAGAARMTGARVIGGNLSEARALSITTTVFGLPFADPITRKGAKRGDSVYVTGTLGASALGFAVLDAGRMDLEHAERFADRWRRPPIHGHAAKLLAEVATASVDVSDGCLQDLRHLCAASGCGARLYADALPLAPGYEETCAALGVSPLGLALGGGEDYELLFTAPSSAEAEAFATKIGEVTEGATVEAVDAEGNPIEPSSAGFRHFS
jgi:thiamine-monophosphate kinase